VIFRLNPFNLLAALLKAGVGAKALVDTNARAATSAKRKAVNRAMVMLLLVSV
jgi:hypothetical protein